MHTLETGLPSEGNNHSGDIQIQQELLSLSLLESVMPL